MKLVREVVSRYDVDGVHFDYLRYPETPRAFRTVTTSAATAKDARWHNGAGTT